MSTAGGAFKCRRFNIGAKVFQPQLSNFAYQGLEVFQLNIPTPAYHWSNPNKTDELQQYYNSVVAQSNPVRVDRVYNQKIDQYTFWTVNLGPQDITLFQIPTPIKNL